MTDPTNPSRRELIATGLGCAGAGVVLSALTAGKAAFAQDPALDEAQGCGEYMVKNSFTVRGLEGDARVVFDPAGKVAIAYDRESYQVFFPQQKRVASGGPRRLDRKSEAIIKSGREWLENAAIAGLVQIDGIRLVEGDFIIFGRRQKRSADNVVTKQAFSGFFERSQTASGELRLRPRLAIVPLDIEITNAGAYTDRQFSLSANYDEPRYGPTGARMIVRRHTVDPNDMLEFSFDYTSAGAYSALACAGRSTAPTSNRKTFLGIVAKYPDDPAAVLWITHDATLRAVGSKQIILRDGGIDACALHDPRDDSFIVATTQDDAVNMTRIVTTAGKDWPIAKGTARYAARPQPGFQPTIQLMTPPGRGRSRYLVNDGNKIHCFERSGNSSYFKPICLPSPPYIWEGETKPRDACAMPGSQALLVSRPTPEGLEIAKLDLAPPFEETGVIFRRQSP